MKILVVITKLNASGKESLPRLHLKYYISSIKQQPHKNINTTYSPKIPHCPKRLNSLPAHLPMRRPTSNPTLVFLTSLYMTKNLAFGSLFLFITLTHYKQDICTDLVYCIVGVKHVIQKDQDLD